MPTIKVSFDLIPAAMINEETFDAIMEQAVRARAEFDITGKLEAICKHEAAHWVYFEKVNIKPLEICGPAVVPKDGKFTYILGGVKPDMRDVLYTSEILIGLANSGVAGICMEDHIIALLNDPTHPLVVDLLKGREKVEHNDRESFKACCLQARLPPHDEPYREPTYWRDAKLFMPSNIRQEAIQREIEQKSTLVRAKFVEA